MDRYRPLIACLLVAGCNAAFDVRETRGPDSDGDGLSDGDDNCTLVANADQRDQDGDQLGDLCDPCEGAQSGQDRDGDGIDDACDECPDGANHDEDGDGALDGCDLCPGVPDAGGGDADLDGVGDPCDAAPGIANRRVFFDGFGRARADWRTWFQDWTITGDGYGPVADGGIGAWNVGAQVVGTGWWIEVLAVTPPQVPADEFGLKVRIVPSGQAVQDCYATFDAGAWRPNGQFQQTTTLTAVTRFRLHSLADGTYQCTIDGVPFDGTGAEVIPDVAYLPNLIAYNGTTFLWVDVVAGP